MEETWKSWEKVLLAEDAPVLTPVVDTVAPKQEVAALNNLGIREILGVGTSNFAGSPPNRRHNIRVGAEAVNGTLIPPGEEFSLLATLGTIDGSTGYLPELVIKGNKTTPEYGGGLCQIGTTTFRGTLAAGLPVTARRNHSYTVAYYFDEHGLPGTDATIYNPAPDYRFKNDTENHVLIVTRIEGNELFFEYWGTKDGRTVAQSDTRVWDRVSPPPTKYIETLDLPVGTRKCTESPHAGIKAAFDYAITYADGAKNETTFFSQYRPWQEVCLVGVEALSEEVFEEGVGVEGADNSAATVN
ncbi:MAG: VanW family protein [Parcubacteria group bacterium]|nr:VanW family protein [Parcubacteria group bacterium]